MRRAHILHRTLVGLLIVAVPGCIMGSPLAAFSGEPYGMVIDDVKAIQGKRGRIWSGASFFAVIDIPIAAVLDTAFLPISLIVWGIKELATPSGDRRREDEGGSRRDRDRGDYTPDRTTAQDRADRSRSAQHQ
jgi:uncharacterized protein YceK